MPVFLEDGDKKDKDEEKNALEIIEEKESSFIEVADDFLDALKDADTSDDDIDEETLDDINMIKGQLEAVIKQIKDALE